MINIQNVGVCPDVKEIDPTTCTSLLKRVTVFIPYVYLLDNLICRSISSDCRPPLNIEPLWSN